MISVTDLRAGTTFEDQRQIFQVLSYEHIKMGRGSANVKVRVKNLRTGATTEKSFISNAQVDAIELTKRHLQFLYKDEQSAHFMNSASFDQVTIPLPTLGADAQYLKEGETFTVSFLDEESLSLLLPPKMVFEVAETGPSTRGNSAVNLSKEATLENGIKIKVPLFVKSGDTVRIDTRTGDYSEKA